MAGFGGAVKLTGESEYRKALKAITDNLTVLSSEMKVVNSLYDKNDTSTDKLAKSNDVLTKKLDAQNQKLAEAKKMLDQAKNSTDSNASTVAKWQTEVNKAQAEVNQTTKEIKDNTAQMKKNEQAIDDVGDELKDFKKGEDDAGQSAIKLGDLIKANVISSAIIGGIKALGSAMVGLAKGAFNLGKQSIESFAEYEQLVGGVDTLFKESSGKVQEYANNAFKTAGLSANEYMETVTSFSASLLQSLDGDTAKSAEVADMAITDMADNANKMGTSMESIQNAYQGFAKQNYTMLDNLKLGYGGTKSEMERLLQDATAISGVEYDISNLNDVYSAIHVIQGELGITGTTAKEASETIQGSISAMKSSWQNLLTGLADGNADLDLLINNLVESVTTVASNIMPLIPTVIQGIGVLAYQLVSELVPQIANTIPQLISDTVPMIIQALDLAISSILSVLPQITQAISELLPVILTSLVNMLPAIIDAGVQIILSLVNGIVASIPTLIPAIVSAVLTIVENLIGNIDMIIDAGIQLIIGLAQGLIDAIPVLLEKIPVIIENLLSALYRNEAKLISAGIQLAVQLAVGLVKAIPQIIASIPQIIKSIIDGFKGGISDMKNVGIELLKGLWDGIKSWANELWNNVKNLGNKITGWFKDVFKIHSPSQVFSDEIGKNLALGLGDGFEDTMADVASQMTNAVPTDFDISASVGTNSGAGQSGTYIGAMVEAFKQALKEVNIVLDDEVAGRFVTDTVERVVYQ
nr:MAG TPA: tail tape measure protein [Caudoviricetes sp.]